MSDLYAQDGVNVAEGDSFSNEPFVRIVSKFRGGEIVYSPTN